MDFEYYSQRLLNPFRGVMQGIRYGAAEAVTLDGEHWDLYVSNDERMEGIAPGDHAQVSDIRYGHWSAGQGLRRGPIYPSEDFRRMEILGALVYEHLLRVHGRVPFPLRDDYELWLLDTRARHHALVLDKNHRLYPQDVDREFLRVARMEALLRRAQGEAEVAEAAQSPFYMELNPRGAA